MLLARGKAVLSAEDLVVFSTLKVVVGEIGRFVWCRLRMDFAGGFSKDEAKCVCGMEP